MEALKRSRNEATVKEHEIDEVESNDFPGNFYDTYVEDIWDFDVFVEKFKVNIIRREKDELEFDLVGVSPAFSNALRRILISEVPTIAIEKVQIYNNTSLFQDDFLAHRLGLIPIKVDPRYFDYCEPVADREENSNDTLIFELKLKCFKEKASESGDVIVHRNVYTKHLTWVPIGTQEELFAQEAPRPVHDDILIAKLNPGQELDLRLVCVKGIGRDHAKFSPVSTASYRLLPKIEILQEVVNEDADLLKESFTDGVIEIINHKGNRFAKVSDARRDLCSRNIFRHEHLKDAVRMTLIKDHFIFTIESTGALQPNELFQQAIDILMLKCGAFLTELQDVKR